MLKVLIVDNSETVRRYLTKQLGDLAQVVACDTDVSVPEQVCVFEPDIIMLDMMLKGQDGVEVIQAIRSSGRNPFVLATVDHCSEFVRARLQSLRVDHIVSRPYKLTALSARLQEMIQFAMKLESVWKEDEQLATDALFALGLQLNKNGYPCVHSALLFLMKNPHISMTKELYPKVAAVCGGSDKRVERAIRCDIQKAWEHRDSRIWQLYFAADGRKKERCPSNGVFLGRIAACLLKEKKIV